MTGQIDSIEGNVKVEIHPVFRILLLIILVFPLVAIILMAIFGT